VNATTANHTVEKTKAQQLQNRLYRAAKLSRTRRFHALYDKLWRIDILERAWFEVAKNRGAPGVDGVTIESIEEVGVAPFLATLAASLADGTYRHKPVRRVRIEKPDGGERLLGVPCVADRCVQAAAKLLLEPIFEADFSPCSYGFRPRRSAHQALDAIRAAVKERRRWIVDVDIKTFFDSVDRDKLLALVAGAGVGPSHAQAASVLPRLGRARWAGTDRHRNGHTPGRGGLAPACQHLLDGP
jgi:RNA-directed DNA polymerase